MTRRLSRTTAGLAIGITGAVSLACAAGAYFYSIRHYETLLQSARGTARSQAELVRAALEHGMLDRDQTLTAGMLRSFAGEPGVTRVLLLDRQGVVQQSSGAPLSDGELSLASPTCQACHRDPAPLRSSSRVIETAGGTILRTVVPVPNRPACHTCHDPSHAINGIVLFDVDAGMIRASADRDLRWLVTGTVALALLLIAAIAIVVRLVILRRLQRFEVTARQITAGQLERRVPSSGSDTISWLADEFNVMADAVTRLLREVRGERERLETVINSIDDGIVVLDARRTIVAANDPFLARTGGVRERMLGCSCAAAADRVCGGCDCPTLACLQSGERQVRIFTRQALDGTTRWEEVHASLMPADDSGGRQVVEVWRDITERRAAEARMAESHRLASLGMLASGFSHELNTPLATVLACVEGIAREADDVRADWPYVENNASIAREQILRCRGITQHFLRMSRGRRSPGDIVDVHTAAASVIRLVEPTARAQGVAITLCSPGPARLHVRADEADLHHALMNLVLNAVQAQGRAGGTGPVAVTIAGEASIHLRVSDHGPGIAAEHQARIFEPFFSLREGGTGLGLFLALTSVRQWHGDIRVQSAPPAGATFEIILPALAADAPRVA